ncbi:MAG: transglutaminase domain-containing protein [Thermosphaera sp.]
MERAGMEENPPRSRRALALLTIALILSVVLTVLILRGFYPNIFNLGTGGVGSSKSFCDWFREKHLSVLTNFDPGLREASISMLNEYSNPEIILQNTSYYIPAGRRVSISFYATSGATISLYITVQNYDIIVRIYDPSGSLILSQRASELSYSFSALSTGTYVLELDNRYSLNTGKQVFVSLKAVVSLDINDPVYKTMAIAHWVGSNVKYVSDPNGFEYVAPPLETLRVRAGDCDDFAVLLASLYESIGLDAVIGLVDTNGDGVVDHAATMVYLNMDPDSLLNAMKKYELVFNVRIKSLSYFTGIKNVSTGLWLIVDPPMADVKQEPWSISHRPYNLDCIIDVYFKR